MRMHNISRSLALSLPLILGVSGCILVPQLENRIVELAVGASTTYQSHATGSINTGTFSDASSPIDLKGDVDLPGILDDNGVDVGDVKSVKVAGLSYRIVTPQAGRSISGTNVTLKRGNASPVTIVSNFSASAGSATGWIDVTNKLTPGGVTLVNQILADLLTDAKGQTPLNPSFTVVYSVTGSSTPTNQATDFTWEIKLDLSIVGTVHVKVPN
jgi:hypothetical protein